jgi:CRP-like cAMP-binding protein
VQSAGNAYRLPRPRLKDEFNRHGELLMLMLRYARCLTTQMAQTAVCNRRHTLEQRLCRWLLLSMDRLPTDTLTTTQDLIANMLGVSHEDVTEVVCKLQKLGVIHYLRGRITVIERVRLEAMSCECYAVLKAETHRVFPYASSALTQHHGLSQVSALSAA